MAEAIGLVSGLLTLVSAAHTTCAGVSAMVNSIRYAPEQIAKVAEELAGLYAVLGTLRGLLDDTETARGVIHPCAAAAVDLEAVIGDCMVTLREIGEVGETFIGRGTASSRRGSGFTVRGEVWRRVRWAVIDEREVERLRGMLAAQKVTLSLAIATANLINTTTVNHSTRRIEDEVLALRSSLTELFGRLDLLVLLNEQSEQRGTKTRTRQPSDLPEDPAKLSRRSINGSSRPPSYCSDSSNSTYATARSSWEGPFPPGSSLPVYQRRNGSQRNILPVISTETQAPATRQRSDINTQQDSSNPIQFMLQDSVDSGSLFSFDSDITLVEDPPFEYELEEKELEIMGPPSEAARADTMQIVAEVTRGEESGNNIEVVVDLVSQPLDKKVSIKGKVKVNYHKWKQRFRGFPDRTENSLAA